MEVIFAIIVSLGVGIYMGRSQHQEASAPQVSEGQHQSRMLQCRSMCGKERVRSYDVLTGECMCIEHRN